MMQTSDSPIPIDHATDAQAQRRSLTMLCARYWPDRYGGLEHKVWMLSNTFAQHNLSVRVITENRLHLAPMELIRPELIVQRLPELQTGRLWRWMDLLRVNWWKRAVRDNAPQGTIWASDPMMAMGAILAGRRRDLVYQCLGCLISLNRMAQVYPQFAWFRSSRAMCMLDRLAYRLAPTVIFESANAQLQFEQAYGHRPGTHMVTNGVSRKNITELDRLRARQQFNLQPHQFVIGFVGRIDPCKDMGFLLRALAQTNVKENTKLLVVGDGPQREAMQSLAGELGIADHIVWTGRLNDATPAYAAMDVLVLPSVYEVFGNVILEAMACGVPAIGRRRDDRHPQPVLTASQQLIQHARTGWLVDSHDTTDLAHRLSEMHNTRSFNQRMGQHAQRFARQHTWERAVTRYLQIVDEDVTTNTVTEPAMLMPVSQAV